MPKSRRTERRGEDKEPYKARHLTANACPHLKRWRGIATRDAKHTSSFLAAVHIRWLVLWLQFRDCTVWTVHGCHFPGRPGQGPLPTLFCQLALHLLVDAVQGQGQDLVALARGGLQLFAPLPQHGSINFPGPVVLAPLPADFVAQLTQPLLLLKLLAQKQTDDIDLRKIYSKVKIYEKNSKGIFVIDDFNIGISSSMIRNLIKNNQNVRYIVTDDVYDYIKKEKLYIYD